MKVTIKDIAKIAGVTHPTVSKALNNEPGVSEETRNKILSLAKQLNYVPNLAAKRLTDTKTNSIGMIWPRATAGLFIYHLGTKIQQEAAKHGVNIVMSLADADVALRTFNQHFVDMVVMWMHSEWIPTIDFLREKDIYNGQILVAGGVKIEGTHRIDIDRKTGIYTAMNHLVENGHKRITFVGQQSEKMVRYMQCLMDFSMDRHPDYILEVKESEDIPEEEFAQLLKRNPRPTAFIVDNQSNFFNLMRLIRKYRIRIPEDFSLIAYDDVPEMQLFDVAVTTIGPSVDKIASEIMDVFNRKEVMASKKEWRDVSIVPELTIRASTSKVNQ